jgi:hypothetical protein
MDNIAEYGHPNIPLGTTAGKQCKTLRRLAFQNKLAAEEVRLLDGMGFRWNSFEDVYEEADFDDCLSRLVEYERVHGTGYQIPKKCREDPELGAWVTMIRRIGRDGIDDGRRERLDGIGQHAQVRKLVHDELSAGAGCDCLERRWWRRC